MPIEKSSSEENLISKMAEDFAVPGKDQEKTKILDPNSSMSPALNAYMGPEKPKLDSEKASEKANSSPLTRRQIFTIISLSIMKFSSSTCYSIISPFFPIKAAEMKVSESVTGVIFGVYALTIFVAAPAFGKILPRLGVRLMFLGGMALGGVSTIAFGVLDEAPAGIPFAALCLVIRIVEALSCAACVTASYVIIVNEFPQGVATASATVELFNGLGFICGPPIGGLLYDAAGYKLPFITLGVFMLFGVVMNLIILPRQDCDASQVKNSSLLKLLQIPAILIIALVTCAGSVALSFMNPLLSLQLEQFKLNNTLVGLIFLLIAACYSLSAWPLGWLSDNKGAAKLIMTIGLFMSSLSYFMVGPCPFISNKSELWVICVALAILGFSLSAILVPILRAVLDTTRFHGIEENVSTYSIVSGLFYAMYSLGVFLGPTLGGFLKDATNFGWATTICGILMMLMGTIMASFMIYTRRQSELNESEGNSGWVVLRGLGRIDFTRVPAQQQS